MIVEQSLKEVDVSVLDLEPPVILNEGADVRTVLDHMKARRSGYALLTDGDRLVGIFTERDVLLRILPDAGAFDDPIRSWMTRRPRSVTLQAPLGEILEIMRTGGFRSVPVVDNEERVIACVRHHDIIAYLAQYPSRTSRAELALPYDR
jgi:arabinose-5-phosphate isomerase